MTMLLLMSATMAGSTKMYFKLYLNTLDVRFAFVVGQRNMVLKCVTGLECFVTIDTDMRQSWDMGFSVDFDVLFGLGCFATLVAAPAISIVNHHGHKHQLKII